MLTIVTHRANGTQSRLPFMPTPRLHRVIESERRRHEFYMQCAWVGLAESWGTPEELRERSAEITHERTLAQVLRDATERRQLRDNGPGRDGRPMDKRLTKGRAAWRDWNCDPFEWLLQHGKLREEVRADRGDRREDVMARQNQARSEAGTWFREIHAKAAIAPVRCASLETMGVGGGGEMSADELRIDAITKIDRLRRSMPRESYDALDRLIVGEVWLWRDLKGSEREQNKRRGQIFDDIRRALDYVSLHRFLISAAAFRARWPDAWLPRGH